MTHFADSELSAYLPQISEFAGNWNVPQPGSEDFSGPAEGITVCAQSKAAGILHRAKLYATNTVGTTSTLKVSMLDFGSIAAANGFVTALGDFSGCSAKGLEFKKLSLSGRCDRSAAGSAYVSGDRGAAVAIMACRHANLVVGLGVSENNKIHPGPFNQQGLQAYFDALARQLQRLQNRGRALP